MAKGLEFGMTKQQRVREIEDRDEAQAEIIEKYGRAKVGRAIKEFCWVCKWWQKFKSCQHRLLPLQRNGCLCVYYTEREQD